MHYPTHPDFAWTYPVSASAYPAAAHALLPGSSVPLTGVGEVPYLQAITISPLAAVMREAKKMQQAQGGLGDPFSVGIKSPEAALALGGLALAVAAVVIGGAAFGGYYAGKAMAPSKDKQTKYGLWGIPVAVLTGPMGLGVMAYIGGRNK